MVEARSRLVQLPATAGRLQGVCPAANFELPGREEFGRNPFQVPESRPQDRRGPPEGILNLQQRLVFPDEFAEIPLQGPLQPASQFANLHVERDLALTHRFHGEAEPLTPLATKGFWNLFAG